MGLFRICAARRVLAAFQLACDAFSKEVCPVLLGGQDRGDPREGIFGKLRLSNVGPERFACHGACITHIRLPVQRAVPRGPRLN